MLAAKAPLRQFQMPLLTGTPGRWLRHDGNGVVLAAGLVYMLLYLWLWPTCWTSMDESCYMGMAYAIRHGTLYPDVAGVPIVSSFPVGAHMVSKYPLGMPLLLAGMSVFGWKAALGTNLLVHLATFIIVIRLLRRLNIPALFALLYLFHPTAVLFSRTVMADPVSGLLLALAFESLLRLRSGWCGAFVGAAILCRTGNALALPIFLATFLWPRPQIRSALVLLAGAAPFLGLAAYYALVVADGQMGQHTGSFSLGFFPKMFPGYALALLLIYPGMMLTPAFYRGPRRATLMAFCYGMLMLYSFWYYRDQGKTPLETLIVGQRYFLAVLPLLIISYSAVLWALLRVWPESARAALAAVACLCLFSLTVGISFRHARYIGTLAEVRSDLLKNTRSQDILLCNTQVGKIMHPEWGRRSVVLLSGPLTPVKAELVASEVQAGERVPGVRVFAAAWVRPGRKDDLNDALWLDDVRRQYLTRLATPFVSRSFPPGMTFFQIIGRSPAKTTGLARNLHIQ